jgi:hypothetical protein
MDLDGLQIISYLCQYSFHALGLLEDNLAFVQIRKFLFETLSKTSDAGERIPNLMGYLCRYGTKSV